MQGINDLVTPFMAVFMSEHQEGRPLEGWSLGGCTEETLLDIEADCYWWVDCILSIVRVWRGNRLEGLSLRVH